MKYAINHTITLNQIQLMMLRRILFVFIFGMSNYAIAEICTDDYIISGSKFITLLPDIPFKISTYDTHLIVQRGTLVLKFSKPSTIYENQKIVTKYSTELIGEVYYFELTTTDDEKQKKWEQYSSDTPRRGFGGMCVAE